MSLAVSVLAGVGLDALLGEPRRWHPLVGFGRLAATVERHLNHPAKPGGRLRGLLAVGLLVSPAIALAAAASLIGGPLVGIALLYVALGGRSLIEHGRRVLTPLTEGDLPAARQAVGLIVSRDTAPMGESDIARATVESLLENGNDAVFGALFWFLVGGAPGVVLYRLANTLDAMWGYRTERYREFGWAAARLDDLLNLVPARLTALTYALVGQLPQALHCWRAQAGGWESPNAGPVMAAGAGALGIQLGGADHYHGAIKARPILGTGHAAVAGDIRRAVALLYRGIGLWVVAILLWGVGHA